MEGRLNRGPCWAFDCRAAIAATLRAAPTRQRPGSASRAQVEPCRGSLQTTVIDSSGASHRENPKNAKKPPIDCFYVTRLSRRQDHQLRSLHRPGETAIAQFQAAHFSQRCRVFAPCTGSSPCRRSSVPRRRPLPSNLPTPSARGLEGVPAQVQHGRGVVLIGHSQGSAMLEQLIRRRSTLPAARSGSSRRSCSAQRHGEAGQRRREVFRHVPGCRSARQTPA